MPALHIDIATVGIHDAFELYGRPRLYGWDPRDPRSMMFAYPIGQNKEVGLISAATEYSVVLTCVSKLLFLDRDMVEGLDVRDDKTSSTRMHMHQILWGRMRDPNFNKAEPPLPLESSLPPIPHVASDTQTSQLQSNQPQNSQPQGYPQSRVAPVAGPSGNRLSMQLPLLDFQVETPPAPKPNDAADGPRGLSPIKEQSIMWDRQSHTGSGDQSTMGRSSLKQSTPASAGGNVSASNSMLGGSVITSPVSTTGPPTDLEFNRRSEDSYGFSNMSRPDSKLSHLASKQGASSSSQAGPSSPSPKSPSFAKSSPFIEPKSPLSPKVEEDHLSAAKLVPPRAITTPSGYSSSSSTRPTSPPVSVLASSPSGRESKPRSETLMTSPHSPQSGRETSSGSPRLSVLTSPYSFKGEADGHPGSPHPSMMTSPYSIQESPEMKRNIPNDTAFYSAPSGRGSVPLASPVPMSRQPTRLVSPPAQSPPLVATSSSSSTAPPMVPAKDDQVDNLLGEAGALYYMRQIEAESNMPPTHHQLPLASDPEDEDEETSSSGSVYTPPPRMMTSPLRIKPNSSIGQSPPPSSKSPPFSPPRRGTPMSLQSTPPPNMQQQNTQSSNPARPSLKTSPSSSSRPAAGGTEKAVAGPLSRYASVAKPSGARAAPGNKLSSSASLVRREPQPQPVLQQPPTIPDQPDEEEDMSDEERLPYDQPSPSKRTGVDAGFDDHADALAALTFLEQEDVPPPPQQKPLSPSASQVVEPPHEPSPAPGLPTSTQPRSSFAPSRQVAERKAKSQAQQAASQAAAHRPGRANGKGKTKTRDQGAWGESSDEEEEEEDDEEEEEDADSDEEPPPRIRMEQPQNIIAPTPSMRPPIGYPSAAQGFTPSPAGSQTDLNAYPQGRRLPQVPGQMGPGHMLPPGGFPKLIYLLLI